MLIIDLWASRFKLWCFKSQSEKFSWVILIGFKTVTTLWDETLYTISAYQVLLNIPTLIYSSDLLEEFLD